ncbi:hypothetical protein LZ32DRAFT_610003 [Colletotrichum eremochloae]|nr:hypothetical protein LZ32DRAFT_610003 [Colletotrichum eremochloae]
MDHTRCAALHNYLVDYRLAVEDDLDPAVNREDTFMSTHGAAASGIISRLHPSVAAFLAAARTPTFPFFYFAHSFPNTAADNDLDGLFDNDLASLYSEPEDSLLRLYLPVIESGGESGGGLIYHQGRHVAAFFMHIDDMSYALPVDEHPTNWHPLETVLSNWVELIRLGKVIASPAPAGLYGSEKVGPWEWRPYGDGQVAACVAAWDRLCGAIEERQGQGTVMVDDDDDDRHEPLLTPVALDTANIPNPSFARDFLRLARRPPRICSIAPGFSLPPADGPSFAAAQPYARLLQPGDNSTGTQQDPVVVPPVYIFFSGASDEPVDVTGWRTSFRGRLDVDDDDEAARILPSSAPAGVYTEGVARGRELDCAEEGFRLLLPFAIAARKSDGSEVDSDVVDGLFQHGYKPFGGAYHRPQRLERLLDHWAGLVRRGVWAVGPRGVEGGLDVFRHSTVDGTDYVIPPSW